MPVPPRDVVAWADGARVCVVAGHSSSAHMRVSSAPMQGQVAGWSAHRRATPALTLECSEVVEAVEVDVDRRQHAGALSRGLRSVLARALMRAVVRRQLRAARLGSPR